MAISVISISSDSLDESVGSSPSRIILFGTIPAEIPAETPTIPPVAPTLPHTSPFLYTDSYDSGTSKRPSSQDPYEILSAPPGLPHRLAVLVLLGQSIPFGRPYRTQPNGVRNMLTTRKRVRALPSGHLASRYPLDHSSSDHFSSDNSSSDSSPDSSSDYSSDSSSGHSVPDYSVDTPATISARPSHKRFRSLVVSVPLATPVTGALPLVRANLLPPRKRIRDIDVDTTAAEAAAAIEANVGVEDDIGSNGKDEAEEEAESGDRGTIEIRVDRVSDIESAWEEQGRRMLAASEQRVGMLDRIGVLERDNMRMRGMLCVKRERVDNLRRHMSYTQEELRQMHVYRYYDRAEFRRLETFALRHLGYRP
ncbi:hypothetical protein Tco_0855924 [Tanacetum coccineum]